MGREVRLGWTGWTGLAGSRSQGSAEDWTGEEGIGWKSREAAGSTLGAGVFLVMVVVSKLVLFWVLCANIPMFVL